ncbi:MAG: hypothetical protein GXP16_09085 [Gammaproteobacteria bacterium]|nr:hypothetical protein [Gammaproteobacteria bacterium]
MQPDQYHLCKISEECAEVSQRAMKAQQFGLGEIQPGQPLNNLERLVLEFHDLVTTFDNFIGLIDDNINLLPSDHKKSERRAKMNKFLQLSKDLDQVDEETTI